VNPQSHDRPGGEEVEHPVEELAALVGGELDLPSLQAVTRHLRSCPSCRAELVEVAAGMGGLLAVQRNGMAESLQPPPLAIVPGCPTGVSSALPGAGATPSPVVAPGPGATPSPVVAPGPGAPPAPGGGPATEGPTWAAGEPGSTGVTPLAPSHARRARPARLVLLTAAAAVVALVGIGVLIGRTTGGGSPTVRVALAPAGPVHAGGSVVMAGSGADRTMRVTTTDLRPAPPGSFYEVWLLEPSTNHMVAVGVLGTDGRGRYSLPTAVVGRYRAVDISLQPDNGSTVHSSDSVLRATYS